MGAAARASPPTGARRLRGPPASAFFLLSRASAFIRFRFPLREKALSARNAVRWVTFFRLLGPVAATASHTRAPTCILPGRKSVRNERREHPGCENPMNGISRPNERHFAQKRRFGENGTRAGQAALRNSSGRGPGRIRGHRDYAGFQPAHPRRARSARPAARRPTWARAAEGPAGRHPAWPKWRGALIRA